MQEANVTFTSENLKTSLTVLASQLSMPFDEHHPLLNAQLQDGSRIAATHPPITRPGLSVTIRKFPRERYTMQDLIGFGALSEELAEQLKDIVIDGGTCLISGSTDAGKTTLLNAMTDFIPTEERLVVIEDTPELRIAPRNYVAMACRNKPYEGQEKVTFDDLLMHALRMRPDKIILGEVRDQAARTLLDSFNTGHGGSLATIHATSAQLALSRLAELAMRAHEQSNRYDISQEIGACVNYVIQAKKTAEGRRVTQVIKVTGYQRDKNEFQCDTIFELNHSKEQVNGTH
jgi:pilus assembly protein CpaF